MHGQSWCCATGSCVVMAAGGIDVGNPTILSKIERYMSKTTFFVGCVLYIYMIQICMYGFNLDFFLWNSVRELWMQA